MSGLIGIKLLVKGSCSSNTNTWIETVRFGLSGKSLAASVAYVFEHGGSPFQA